MSAQCQSEGSRKQVDLLIPCIMSLPTFLQEETGVSDGRKRKKKSGTGKASIVGGNIPVALGADWESGLSFSSLSSALAEAHASLTS